MDRFIELRDDQGFESADNAGTSVGPIAIRDAYADELSCEVAFVSHYTHVRDFCRSISRPGLAAFAIDDNGVAATAFFPAPTKSIEVAIAGRHGRADLWIDDPNVALRHLAIVVEPRTSDGVVRYRVLDLRTRLGLRDERGVPVESFTANGPVFVHVGKTVLLLITLDGKRSWPTHPLDGWRAFPDRIYDRDPLAMRRQHGTGRGRSDGEGDAEITHVGTMPGPSFAREHVREFDDPIAELEVRAGGSQTTLLIGPRAAREGVLFGRYARCDNASLSGVLDNGISRVHLLLIEVGGVVWAIDTASSNGVWVRRTRSRRHALKHSDQMVLGRELATLVWRRAG